MILGRTSELYRRAALLVSSSRLCTRSTCATTLHAVVPLASSEPGSKSSRSGSYWSSFSSTWMAAPLGLGAAMLLSASGSSPAWADFDDHNGEGSSLLSLKTRQRMFFAYEKRIRDNSPLDKVFDYFSNRTAEDGSRQMCPHALLNAIVPTFPPSKSHTDRAGSLAGERQPQDTGLHKEKLNKFFKQFDLDGDGTVSYLEFLLLLTLVSIPKDDVPVIFGIVDEDGNGTVDADEFQVIMNLMQSRAVQGASKGLSFGRTAKLHPRVVATSASDCTYHSDSLLVMFFGRDNSNKLDVKRFRSFLGQLHDELIKLEFEHYMPNEKGFIPGTDFARSLVASASLHVVFGLLDKIDAMEEKLANTNFSFAEFDSIYRLQCNLRPIQVALEFVQQLGRPITRAEFSRLVIKYSNIRLSDQVLDTIMRVFDNGKGSLDVASFIDAMKRKLNTVHASKFSAQG